MRLKTKKAFITGGSKGIGRGIAKSFLLEGAEVLICGRSEETLKNTFKELSSRGEIDFIAADISSKDNVAEIADYISTKWDKMDVLVNNASILGDRVPILEYPEDVWDEVIEINLNAQFYVTKAVLPLILKSGSGSIINVSSSVGRSGRANWGAYSVSKFGLEGLTQILSDELKSSNVRVNSVNPGGTRTDMRAEAYPEEDPTTLPTPEDIAPIFVYLASDESVGVTGEEFDARDWIN